MGTVKNVDGATLSYKVIGMSMGMASPAAFLLLTRKQWLEASTIRLSIRLTPSRTGASSGSKR